MKRIRLALSTTLIGCLLASCNGSSSPTTINLPQVGAALADCTAGGQSETGSVVDALFSLFDAIAADTSPAGGSYNDVTGVFSIQVLDDNGVTVLGTLDGTLSPALSYAEGLLVGGTVTATWTLSAGADTTTGSGTLTFALSTATSLHLTGNLNFSDGGCSINVTSIDVTVDPTSDTGNPTGTIQFTVTDGTNTMSGTITYDGSAIASVSVLVNGTLPFPFSIDLDTDSVILP